jgi:hypothetical protein
MTTNAQRSHRPSLKLVPINPDEGKPGHMDKPQGVAGTGRLQLLLPTSSVERLEAIKDTIEAASYAEVIRRALRLYEAFLAEERDGGHVFVRREGDGGDVIIPLSFLFH